MTSLGVGISIVAVAVVLVAGYRIYKLLFVRSSSEVSEDAQINFSPRKIVVPHIYTSVEIKLFRKSDSFEIETNDGHSVALSAEAATQVHWYSAPTKGCACSCKNNRELEGYTIGVTRPEIASDALVVADSRTSLIVDLRAAHKLHALLRPDGCRCSCSAHGITVAVPA